MNNYQDDASILLLLLNITQEPVNSTSVSVSFYLIITLVHALDLPQKPKAH